MATFISGSKISTRLEEMIQQAEKHLWFISPYIQLGERIKDELNRVKHKFNLEIVILIGKNEINLTKSLNRGDVEFFKGFPNIKICYKSNLHAKYYANESCGLITSMNLHQFSQNNNIEAGVVLEAKGMITGLAGMVAGSADPDLDSYQYFEEIIKGSEILFENKPQFEKGLFTKKYLGSKEEINILDTRFPEPKSDYKNPRPNSFTPAPKITITKEVETGYCIRTGRPIPFNIARPMSAEAYQSWQQYKNPDYKEKFCHKTGKPSFGKTSMRNPVLG